MGEIAVGVIFGSLPHWTDDGDGSGSGYGYGSGDGSGYGYGYGSGDGDGYGSGDGDGYGYGYGSGDGDGYGYGSGDGSGDGDGYGYGYGDGYGSGDGSGDGSGSGSGDGYGDGYGSGDGSGDGSGSGSGDGYGDGYGYWLHTFKASVDKWTNAQRQRLKECYEKCSALAFWKSDKNGLPSNGGKSDQPAVIGVIHKSPGPLSLCHAGTLHATMKPSDWKGERLWVVAMFGKVKRDGDKLGALEREILGEIEL